MIDLHLHSEYSIAAKDTFMLRQLAGGSTPQHTSSSIADKGSAANMVEIAAQRGLRALSLTDHWSVDGVVATQARAAACGVELVPGIEIGAALETDGVAYEVHLLAYYYRADDPDLVRLCRDAHRTCAMGSLAFLDGLPSLGIDITMSEVGAESGGRLSSWSVRRLLVRRGYARDKWDATRIQQRAVAHTLGSSSRYRFLRREGVLRVQDLVPTLHGAGASVFMAHPFWLTRSYMLSLPAETAWRHIDLMLACGVDGLEVYYPGPPHETDQLLQYCRSQQLPVSGGSDSHSEAGLAGAAGVPDEALDSILRHRRGQQPWR